MKWEATGKNKLIDKAPSQVTDTWILRLLVENLFLASQVKYAAWSLSNSEKCNDELIFSARFSSWRETERLRSPSLTSMPFMNHLTFGRGQPVTLQDMTAFLPAKKDTEPFAIRIDGLSVQEKSENRLYICPEGNSYSRYWFLKTAYSWKRCLIETEILFNAMLEKV